MSIIKKMKQKKKDLQAQYQRGKDRTEQMKADKLRQKMQQQKYMEPGTIRYGLLTKQNPLDLMKDVKTRRELKRKEKQQKQKPK